MGVGTSTDRRFRGYRFPAIIVGEVVWLRYRFNLSLRDIPALMATRGVEVSHETVREWCDKFGAAYAKEIRRRRPRPGDKWHLDELVVKINGVHRYLWRAVDQQGITLGMLVTRRRDASAASRFLRKLLKSEQYVPRVLVTDKLRSYGAAKRHVLHSAEHRQSKYLNNRAENSHQRTRLRERAMRRFGSPGQAGRFCFAHDPIYGHFRPPQHRMDAAAHRATLTDRHRSWNDMTAALLDQPAAACQSKPRIYRPGPRPFTTLNTANKLTMPCHPFRRMVGRWPPPLRGWIAPEPCRLPGDVGRHVRVVPGSAPPSPLRPRPSGGSSPGTTAAAGAAGPARRATPTLW